MYIYRSATSFTLDARSKGQIEGMALKEPKIQSILNQSFIDKSEIVKAPVNSNRIVMMVCR